MGAAAWFGHFGELGWVDWRLHGCGGVLVDGREAGPSWADGQRWKVKVECPLEDDVSKVSDFEERNAGDGMFNMGR